jgi:hypothetical protein
MSRNGVGKFLFASVLIGGAALSATAQSFRVQCPVTTITHPVAANNNSEHTYSSPATFHLGPNGFLVPDHVLGAIKCQQIAGGDGYATMGNGTQTYMFSFGPLSGIADITAGNPGTEFPNVFNTVYSGTLVPGDPATTDNVTTAITSYPYRSNTTPTRPLPPFGFNGAVGLIPDVDCLSDPVCKAGIPASGLDGHVDPRQIMDVGVMNGNIPAPLMAIDEDDEFFLTLTNTGMIMRPDLFEQHTVHFHGYPNASSFYDGVPDASVAINIGGSFTYYYLAPDAGTYFWHCHITPPEHLQMGMVGQIYVRPRQNRVNGGQNLFAALQVQQTDLRTACIPAADIVCTTNQPLVNTGAVQIRNTVGTTANNPNFNQALKYAYNDGDGTTGYTVEYPVQIHGFDPNFHFVGMTFNPEAFADMKDKFFLLNGRSYPDTIIPGPLTTESADGRAHFSQPLPSIINIPAGGKALIRLSDLDVTEYQTLASLGIPMHVVGYNAKLLRDQSGNNTDYFTNSVTLAGGESLDFILDASNTTLYHAGQIFYLFTPNLDHLSNDQENFGGLMTEIHIN